MMDSSALLPLFSSTAKSTSSSSATNAAGAQPSPMLAALHGHLQSSWLARLGRALLLTARVISGLLYWIVTFSTITLPTVLFTLFSTSLTFTMNFTTLYVRSILNRPQWTNAPQDAYRPSFCLTGLMAGKVPLPEHVHAVTFGTPSQGTTDRFVSRHAGRLKAGAGQLSRRVLECNQGVWIP